MRLTGDSSRDSMNLGTKRLFLLSSVRQTKKSSLIRSLPPLLCFTEADGNTAVFGQCGGTVAPFSCRVHRDGYGPEILTRKKDFLPSFFFIFERTPLSLAFFPSWFVYLTF